ncbi:TIGR00159 family protein [Schaedlerella arabinosiphila]|uniref:Diadenylate cyclase n=1 Tax=Schaedlerella arabinosiphila TaxID=2044587 RepID=A0A9X5CBM9_9FIRM|nr:diadenylate cyclase CdaA [Schaedlerella arabinosiphila]KAI4444794.1 Cyclic di-AMP synthase CdaA [Schaedlerella arabinosiphila]MCI9604995.1 TIGR00159 family protein [Ruminococcus sp.]NDO71654.1 TIGR00159 family protein [Schaedlerella arabinosiphila]
MQQEIKQILHKLIGDPYIPELRITDIVEILIIAVIVYEIMLWIKNTKAWMLLRGLLMLGLFILVAYVFRMHAILYLARESIGILAFAALVVFQPELRRALEKLGEKNLFSSFSLFDRGRENLRFSDKTREALVDACFSMGSVKTGALIVVERAIHLTEYEMTGIELDCKISEQVILNIFEHNTPLHDGAVIVRGDRITSATCYLPLSDNMQISKSLGTRHRAALGMSEVSDALILVVSEETGFVSMAMDGQLVRNVTPEYLREKLGQIQNRLSDGKKFTIRKGRQRNEV